MHQLTGIALIRVMACRLFGAKPLPEPMLAYCQLDPWEQTSVKFESSSFIKILLKMLFASRADELKDKSPYYWLHVL